MRYRKKPVVVEAMQLTKENVREVASWVNGAGVSAGVGDAPYALTLLYIQTLEGIMSAEDGDWIIKGVAGEFYPRKDAIFAQTYEAVED